MDVSKYTAHTDYEWAIGLSRINMTILGIWPENNKTTLKVIMSNVRTIVILNIMVWGVTIPAVHSLIRIRNDIMSVIDNLQYSIPFLMAVLKLLIMWQKKKNIFSLLNMIKNDWLKPKTTGERDVMIKRAQIARTLTILGYFIMILSLILCVGLPIFGTSLRYITNRTDPGKLMPLQTYYIYDRDKSPLFEITYILQSIGILMGAVIYTGTDNFLGLLVFHTCGQLENLKARISNLDKFDDFERAIALNVQDHIRLIRFINIIDNIFTSLLFGALISFGTLFAFYGFLYGTMIIRNNDLSILRLTFLIVLSINTFAHTCLYCIVGEILITQCEDIYKAACKYKWYNLEPKKAKNLLIIMIRASRPLYITAGKLFPMTMSTFCNKMETETKLPPSMSCTSETSCLFCGKIFDEYLNPVRKKLLKTSGGYISILLAYRE